MEPASARRHRFGHNEATTVGTADGVPVRAAQLRVRTMNFGQRWRTPGIREVRYRLVLPLAFLAHVLSREWSAYIADAQQFPGDDPLSVALAERHWPEVAQVLADLGLCALACDWFAYDLFLEWLGDGEPTATPGYVLNTVEYLAHEGDAIIFTGTARTADQPAYYQDA